MSRLKSKLFSVTGLLTVTGVRTPGFPSGRRVPYRGFVMKAVLEKAYGYQGDNMNLPVRDVAAALPFYETILGFRVLSRSDSPHNSAVLARDQVEIGLAENGGDPTQD